MHEAVQVAQQVCGVLGSIGWWSGADGAVRMRLSEITKKPAKPKPIPPHPETVQRMRPKPKPKPFNKPKPLSLS
jgi:hypothetical protein